MERKRLHPDFPIYEISDFLSEEEVSVLIELGKPLQKKSLIYDQEESRDGVQIGTSAHRTSTNGALPPYAVRHLQERVADLVGGGVRWGNIENPTVIHYVSGQYFKPHYDSFKKPIPLFWEQTGGQIIATVLVYLNTVPEEGGGATSFPYLGVKVRPVRGKAVLWFHCDDSGSSAEGALHEGEPVMEGFEKWACNFIVHERNCPKIFHLPNFLEIIADNLEVPEECWVKENKNSQ